MVVAKTVPEDGDVLQLLRCVHRLRKEQYCCSTQDEIWYLPECAHRINCSDGLIASLASFIHLAHLDHSISKIFGAAFPKEDCKTGRSRLTALKAYSNEGYGKGERGGLRRP